MTATMEQRQLKRERRAWYLYDFGNSAYAAVVLLAVYSAYFQGTVVGGAEGSRLWGLAVGMAMLVVAIISPVLGSIADFAGSKKRFLFFFTTMACLFTALLFFVSEGDIFWGMALFVLAEIGYRSAQVFYNALLPEIAAPDELASVSGTGWAVGSAGGIICLLLVLPLIVLIGGTLIVRLSLVITAVFFALSAIPIFLQLRERAVPQSLAPGDSYARIARRRLRDTFKAAKSYREFIKFIIAFLVYNDGVIMALDFAAIMGAVLFGLDQQMLIVFVILIQVTNVVGAYVFGMLAGRIGCKHSLALSIVMMVALVIWLFLGRSPTEFFVIGALAGFAMAGIQSVSRSFVGVITPAGRSAEFYGFFSMTGRTASFIGPAVYGLVAAEATLWYQARGQGALLAEQSGQRVAVLSIGVFLLVGLVLLMLVNEKRARAAAQAAAAE